MSRHSTDFEAEREVPVEAVEGLPSPDHRNVVRRHAQDRDKPSGARCGGC